MQLLPLIVHSSHHLSLLLLLLFLAIFYQFLIVAYIGDDDGRVAGKCPHCHQSSYFSSNKQKLNKAQSIWLIADVVCLVWTCRRLSLPLFWCGVKRSERQNRACCCYWPLPGREEKGPLESCGQYLEEMSGSCGGWVVEVLCSVQGLLHPSLMTPRWRWLRGNIKSNEHHRAISIGQRWLMTVGDCSNSVVASLVPVTRANQRQWLQVVLYYCIPRRTWTSLRSGLRHSVPRCLLSLSLSLWCPLFPLLSSLLFALQWISSALSLCWVHCVMQILMGKKHSVCVLGRK